MAAMSMISMGMQLVGGAVQAKGIKAQGDADYESGLYNANTAREDAGIAATQTTADVAKARTSQALDTGKFKAAAGVTGGMTGSNLDILSSNAVQQELDILTIKQQGALTQRSLLNQAGIDIAGAENAKKQSRLEAAAAMLGSASKAAATASSSYGAKK